MSETNKAAGKRDYRKTLFLPKTDFPMRAGLPKKEPEILKRWEEMDLYRRCREAAKGREKYVLHDGPPYANGHLHIGHALNKILKDIITRTRQMMGYDSNYVPGWDCHGLPIEWKVEEQFRAEGKNKDEIPINDFRAECRKFAEHWINVQREEFIRLGVIGDWKNPYTTMAYEAEAIIANELLKFAKMGQLYRGSKPVMWSVVEKTALAEAEVEYHDYTSDTIWVKFPLEIVLAEKSTEDFPHGNTFIVIWTTTPWTIPGNRAISFNPKISYGLYEVKAAPEGNWAKPGERYILADALAADVMKAARVENYSRIRDVPGDDLAVMTCKHPLQHLGYDFDVPLLPGEHVTEEAGTGFVHTAPGHGREDYEVWMDHAKWLEEKGISTYIPFTVDEDGVLTEEAPGFTGRRVLTPEGKKGDANEAVIEALKDAGMLIARARLKHQYPHSWRSKKPVIFRNTPQWFIPMDKPYTDDPFDTLRNRALLAIDEQVKWIPSAGQRRIKSMILNRPDWVVSRQRAWGVPIAIFVHKETGEILVDDEVNRRIIESFRERGADAWFEDGAKERYLKGRVENPDDWEQVRDILDVWFDSGSTHAFVLEQREDLKWPASMYLEGTDQHRGWFHSSLLESCGTRGRAPYESVLTHGFVLDEEGRKMSKSLGNVVSPQDVMKQYGADILRLWVMASDYAEDLRIGPEILKSMADAYRKLRNTIRYMLGALADYDPETERVDDIAQMPELERYILHRLRQVGEQVMKAYEAFDFKRAYAAILNFMVNDLSAFYFDIRKDSLYCDPYSSMRRRSCRTVIDTLFEHVLRWLAPWLAFTAEEAFWSRTGNMDDSIHLKEFLPLPDEWQDDALAEKWRKIRKVRSVITGALEVERKEKRIGSSLEAAPVVFISDADLMAALDGVDMAEVTITSAIDIREGEGPAEAFRLEDVPGVAVVVERAKGRKCARSWKITEDVGTDPEFPDITPRDAEAVREWLARTGQTPDALETED
ncbi:isoleucine--tRNA ligase [Thermopetrobacter sp. TC1]|uniref:isoleucine--tRNA ligase n=1 Tax=Thermopetrobacter sp. TC1 TaxID=1495045 RepID=UPI00056FBADF|nr:isoleucine--tRNA ligase [Thermopetrobacter sp. TC1]